MFGRAGKAAAIMVTLPSEAADDAALVERLVAAGLDCARINCAHDDAPAWAAMAERVKAAARKAGGDCRVMMDLPGPKCRIEALWPAKPERLFIGDRFRLVVAPAQAKVGALPIVGVSFPRSSRGCRCRRGCGSTRQIRGRVVAVEGADRVVEVVGARPKGERVRLEKGVEFPVVARPAGAFGRGSGGAAGDRRAADMIGFSFVQRPQDVVDLDRAIAAVRPGRPPTPLVLKIETLEGVATCPR